MEIYFKLEVLSNNILNKSYSMSSNKREHVYPSIFFYRKLIPLKNALFFLK